LCVKVKASQNPELHPNRQNRPGRQALEHTYCSLCLLYPCEAISTFGVKYPLAVKHLQAYQNASFIV
jgi:hypothetical protein